MRFSAFPRNLCAFAIAVPAVIMLAGPLAAQEPPQEPPVPPARIPGQQDPAPAPPQPSPQRINLNPNISVIGNHFGRFFGVAGDPDRNRPKLGEIEIGLQQAIYPGIRFDAFVAGHADEGFAAHFEEGYLTFSRLGGLSVGGQLGQKRLNIGKVNPVHPHAWLYADTPAPLAYFLGPEGTIGNGISANYTLPSPGKLFANLEVGVWDASAHAAHEEEHEEEESAATLLSRSIRAINKVRRSSRQAEPAHHEPGLGVAGMFPLARLWLSHPIGSGGELEVGTSHGYGKGENGDNILLQAVDLTYRRFPGAFSRWILQTEWFRHRRTDSFGGTGKHSRDGYYAHLGYRPDQYYDYGIRYDNSRYPWPLEGCEKSLSFIWTNRMSEAILFRAQVKHGDRTGDSILPAKKGFTEAWLQFIWGGGTHSHPLQ